ncbi:hypothetical protein BJX68DRAFT_259173 [Aspergillus pseudodeflectus]|uniref:F-box domain-containing protein n=1 Tax=Aspergillus pseudodeflectus TaxID=176178 RepID=A0ABR4JHZ9_9EURO
MATLTSLPLDIQQHIISYLLSTRDVAALSAQCKSLHRLCDMETRHMYHSVKIEPKTGSLDIAFDILMDILRRPALGHYVRHIEVRAPPPLRLDYTEQDPQRELGEADMRLLRHAVRAAGFEAPELQGRVVNMLFQRMDYGLVHVGIHSRRRMADNVFIPQALAALLVSVSPFLESMAMSPMATHEYSHPRSAQASPKVTYPLDHLLRTVNSDPTRRFPYLQNLRDVYIINNPRLDWEDDRFYIACDLFTPISTICTLPSIESVRSDVVEEDGNGRPGLAPRSSDIAKIALHHSSLSASYLASLVCSCRTLRSFAYSVGGRCTNDGGYPAFNPKTLIRGLLYHRETLEHLDLDVDSYIYHFDPQIPAADARDAFDSEETMYDDGPNRSLPADFRRQRGALADFVKLKRLSIGVGLFFYLAWGVDVPTAMERGRDGQRSFSSFLSGEVEYLCLRGYKKGEFPDRDRVLAGDLGGLRVEGVEKTIPNAENVDDPDGNPHLLWRP